MRDGALQYAHHGWRVFPCHAPTGAQTCSCGKADCSKVGKHPRIKEWQEKATTDSEQISAWWSQWPNANIGLVLDGIAVLDVDPRHNGFASLAELEALHGPLDVRSRQRSGSGGYHYLFQAGAGVTTARGFMSGLDLLVGAGCYILAAPSRHASGGVYEWNAEPHPLSTSVFDIDLAIPPQWLISAARAGQGKTLDAQRAESAERRVPRDARPSLERLIGDAVASVLAGKGRNDSCLFWLVQARDNGYAKEEVASLIPRWIEAANGVTKGQEPYTASEAYASLNSAYSRAPRAPWKSAGGDREHGSGLVQELATEILRENHFARDEGGLLYAFEDGVYRPTGERVVQRAVKALCNEMGRGKAWSPELASKVEAYLLVDAPQVWERPPLDTVNVLNGLLDVATRILRPHDPAFLSPVQLNAAFDGQAKCPAIDAFIADVFPADAQHVPAEIVAWLMLPNVSLQKAVLAIGEGANGKSVFLTMLEQFLGRKNVSALALHRIEADKFATARLVGKLANISADLPSTALAGTSLFKSITGGDSIIGERKHKMSFEFRPYVRLVFSANSAPRSDSDASPGFFRRWLVIPFTRTFDESDPRTATRAELDARLSTPMELSGLLNKALDALPHVLKGKITESKSMRAAWQDFRSTTDPLAVWLDSNTVEHADGQVPKETLRKLYSDDCRNAGRPILNDGIFTERLKRLRPKIGTKQRTVNGRPKTWCFVGIGLRADQEPPDDGRLLF